MDPHIQTEFTSHYCENIIKIFSRNHFNLDSLRVSATNCSLIKTSRKVRMKFSNYKRSRVSREL